MHTCMHTHTHTYMHMHTHTYMQHLKSHKFTSSDVVEEERGKKPREYKFVCITADGKHMFRVSWCVCVCVFSKVHALSWSGSPK